MSLRKKIFIVILTGVLVFLLDYIVGFVSLMIWFPNKGFYTNNLITLNTLVPIALVYILCVIIICFSFYKLDKKNKEAIEKYKLVKKENIYANKINENFISVISKDKRVAFKFNLTKDLILANDIIDNKFGLSVLKRYGLDNKASLSAFLNKMNSYIIIDDKHLKKLTYEDIVNYFLTNEEKSYCFTSKIIDIEGNEIISKNEIILFKDINGEILGLFTSDDVTTNNTNLLAQVNYVQNMDKSIATVMSYTYIRVFKLFIDFNLMQIIYDKDRDIDPYLLENFNNFIESELSFVNRSNKKNIEKYLDPLRLKDDFENNKFNTSITYEYNNEFHRIGIMYVLEEDKKVAYILIRDVTKEIEETTRQNELNLKLNEAAKKESQYLEYLLSSSCFNLNVNLSKNKVISLSKFVFEEKEVTIFNSLDKDKSTFSDYIALAGNYVNKDYKEKYDTLFNINKLLVAYNNQINVIEDEILFNYHTKEKLFIRISVILNMNFETGNLECLVACYDVTKSRLFLDKQKEVLKEAFIKAKESSLVKTKFLSNVSHDIKTPLNAIIGMNQIARDNVTNKEVVLDALDKISISSKHLLKMVNEILTLSSLEANKLTLHEEKISLGTLISTFKEMAIGQNGIKQLKMNFDVKTNYKEDILVDETKLNNALINIVNNAIKYTPTGGEINIRIEEKESKFNDYIHLEYIITDNGIGMSEEFIKKLFIPFEREVNEKTSKISGTGIGLSITKATLDLMKGSIEVNSKVGKGTTFKVGVDVKKAINVSNEEETFNIEGMKILIVDDNLMNQEILVKNLNSLGAITSCLQDGNEFVNFIKDNPNSDIDLVLCDIKMPVLDGWEACKIIRSLDSEFARNVKIIALSANAYESDIAHSIEVGMNGYVTKPVLKKELLKEIKKVCGGK